VAVIVIGFCPRKGEVQPAPPCRTCVKPAAEGPKVNVCRRHPKGLGVDFGGRMVRFLACMGRKGEAYRGSFKVRRKFGGTVFGATIRTK
ncbi:MAG: hypothetical protein C0473_02695, partial [Cyanobacteria bacterium DS3.002]|nr:hypothetical protein [Cyanobacteria bacterium DS3.002]